VTNSSSRIAEMCVGYSTFQSFVICKTESPFSFSCKIDILQVVPFLQNRGYKQGVSEGIVNILGRGSMDYSE